MSNIYETCRKFSTGYPKMIQMKKTNKQNKQTNKHLLKYYISQPNQVQSSRNFQGIFLWVFQDDQNNNRSTNKQTNK